MGYNRSGKSVPQAFFALDFPFVFYLKVDSQNASRSTNGNSSPCCPSCRRAFSFTWFGPICFQSRSHDTRRTCRSLVMIVEPFRPYHMDPASPATRMAHPTALSCGFDEVPFDTFHFSFDKETDPSEFRSREGCAANTTACVLLEQTTSYKPRASHLSVLSSYQKDHTPQ